MHPLRFLFLFTFPLIACGVDQRPRTVDRPVVLDDTFTPEEIDEITAAGERWAHVLRIEWSWSLSDDPRLITVQRRTGWSPEGRLGAGNQAGIGLWVEKIGQHRLQDVALHEFGHFFGGVPGHPENGYTMQAWLPASGLCITQEDLDHLCNGARSCTGYERPEC